MVSDKGMQFISDEFHKFTVDWDFEHITSSPYNSKGNKSRIGSEETTKKSTRQWERCLHDNPRLSEHSDTGFEFESSAKTYKPTVEDAVTNT